MRILPTFIRITLLSVPLVLWSAPTSRADSYSWQNLTSDIPGVAEHVDANLVNPWGMTVSPNGTIWVSDNGTGVSTLYHADGSAVSLVVTIPPRNKNQTGTPTGTIFNPTSAFKVSENGTSQPARFLFVSEDGVISGWNPNVDATNAIVAIKPKGNNVYKGVALGIVNDQNFLYATDFRNAEIDVYDEILILVKMRGVFAAPNLPPGFPPLNIPTSNGQLYVIYAMKTADKRDDVAGPGNGFIDVFD